MNQVSKKKWWYEVRLFFVRFLLMGLFAYVIEIFYTSFSVWFKIGIFRLTWLNFTSTMGYTHVLAFLLYGVAATIYTFLYEPLMKVPFLKWKIIGPILRYAIYALSFMALELLVGLLLRYALGITSADGMWDYSHKWGNILGLIAFSMFPVWWIAGMIGEFLHVRLLAIDDILLNFKTKGYPSNTKEARTAYIQAKVMGAEMMTLTEHKSSPPKP